MLNYSKMPYPDNNIWRVDQQRRSKLRKTAYTRLRDASRRIRRVCRMRQGRLYVEYATSSSLIIGRLRRKYHWRNATPIERLMSLWMIYHLLGFIRSTYGLSMSRFLDPWRKVLCSVIPTVTSTARTQIWCLARKIRTQTQCSQRT